MKLRLPSLGVPFVEILAAISLVTLAGAAWVQTRPEGMKLVREAGTPMMRLCAADAEIPCRSDESAPSLRAAVEN